MCTEQWDESLELGARQQLECQQTGEIAIMRLVLNVVRAMSSAKQQNCKHV
jgi:hypothetical protein